MLLVRDHPEASRYEASLDDMVVGVLDYWAEGPTIVLTHAGVDPAYQGRGIGSQLVREALDDLRSKGRLVVPRCSFVAAFIRRNREYAELLAS